MEFAHIFRGCRFVRRRVLFARRRPARFQLKPASCPPMSGDGAAFRRGISLFRGSVAICAAAYGVQIVPEISSGYRRVIFGGF